MPLGRALSLTPVRKVDGFAPGCEAGYLFCDIVTDRPGVNGHPNSRPLGVTIRRNSSGDRPVTRTITPSGVLISAIGGHQLGASLLTGTVRELVSEPTSADRCDPRL